MMPRYRRVLFFTRIRRIVIILPCCIGDVVMATATLTALRRGYPLAHITWAVGGWSRRAIEYHPDVDAILDTGSAANPAKSLTGFAKLVYTLRRGKFDMAVSLVRSPLMSLAVLLSGIKVRVGLDSNDRGFGYTIGVPVIPTAAMHEAEIYLDTAVALGINTTGCYANLPVLPKAQNAIEKKLRAEKMTAPYFVINPAGGSNPGMMMDSKRYPPEKWAAIAHALADTLSLKLVIVVGPDDKPIVEALQQHLKIPAVVFLGNLTFAEIGALAGGAQFYMGNDTGLTHLAAASGTKTITIFGPSDPLRYAPYTPQTLALWKPAKIKEGGVVASGEQAWDWQQDGIGVEEVIEKTLEFVKKVE